MDRSHELQVDLTVLPPRGQTVFVPLDAKDSVKKQAKLAVHDAADKHRKQARGKQRDKRSTVY